MSYINPFDTHASPPNHPMYTRPESVTTEEARLRLQFIGWAPLWYRCHFDGYPWAKSIHHDEQTNCPTWVNGECRCMVEVE